MTELPGVHAERPVAIASPSLANGAGDGWRCTCGAGPHAIDGERCARGHVRTDNSLARQLGIYARRQPADLQELINRLMSGVISDLGGEDELSTLERGYIGKLGTVEAALHLLANDISERGLLTPSGGVRRVYDALLAGIDRWDRLAQRLGMKRRPRQVADTFDAAIAAEPEAR